MPYIILFIIIFIFLGFSLLFQWMLSDSSRQLYIVGLALFYALCTLILRSPSAAHFIGNLTHGWALIIYEFSLLLSVWCAVAYTMTIIQDKHFRTIMGLCMMTELLAFIITAVLRHYDIHFYLQIFFVSILVIGGFSVIIGIVYMILNWGNIAVYNRILLIATFIMIFWFISSLVLNLQNIQYAYVCGTGIVLYFLVYTIVSAGRLRQKMLKKYSMNNADTTINYIKPSVYITNKEKQLLDIMSKNNVTNSKDIMIYLPDGSSESSINTALSRLMKKTNSQTREDLLKLHPEPEETV